MTSQLIAMHILPNISRSESNQTLKCCQLIEFNRNIFLENHTQNLAEKLVIDPFLKNQNIALDQPCKNLFIKIKFVFVVRPI